MESINIQQKELISPRGIKGDVRLFLSRMSTKGYRNLPSSMSGAGTSLFNDKERGLFLSEMEAIERIANSMSISRCLVSDAESLGDLAANIDEFPTISKISEPTSINNEYSSKRLLRWIQSIELQSKSQKYIPLEFVSLYTNRLFNGEGITNPISTGMSVHDNYTHAILNGIYEVIERDAIALTWLLKYPGKRITNNPYELDFNVFDNEILCHCGKRGCLETEVSGAALQRKLIHCIKNGKQSILSDRVLSDSTPLTLDEIVSATNQEDLLCIHLHLSYHSYER